MEDHIEAGIRFIGDYLGPDWDYPKRDVARAWRIIRAAHRIVKRCKRFRMRPGYDMGPKLTKAEAAGREQWLKDHADDGTL